MPSITPKVTVTGLGQAFVGSIPSTGGFCWYSVKAAPVYVGFEFTSGTTVPIQRRLRLIAPLSLSPKLLVFWPGLSGLANYQDGQNIVSYNPLTSLEENRWIEGVGVPLNVSLYVPSGWEVEAAIVQP